jgi:hypothetical protein
MPGIGDDIDGAMQQAAQPIRHSIDSPPVAYNQIRQFITTKAQRHKGIMLVTAFWVLTNQELISL